MDMSVATPDQSAYYYVTAFWPLLPFHRGIFHLHINNSLPINRPIIYTLLINSWVAGSRTTKITQWENYNHA